MLYPAAIFSDLNECPAIVNTGMTVPVGGTTYRGTSTFAHTLQFPNTSRFHERVVFRMNPAFNGTQVLAQSDHLPIAIMLIGEAGSVRLCVNVISLSATNGPRSTDTMGNIAVIPGTWHVADRALTSRLQHRYTCRVPRRAGLQRSWLQY